MMTDLMLMLSPVNLIIFVLVMGRLSGMIATAPFFSTIQAPMQAKAILVFMTAFIMYPMVAASTPDIVTSHVIDLPVLMVLMFKEVAVGAIIGFCANLIFVGVQMAGQILSM
ncbi:MAG: flagellar biosynthetic protein FliR, partial [Candidatus Gastranaerophilales bacterium]|nr:flagellar biosynthetic protein FliR [Candidatus Gastranaerophilales bacterium]